MQDSSFQRPQSLVSSESRAPMGTDYAVNVSPSAFVQPSPSAPVYSLPWAAAATVTAQPPPAAVENAGAAKNTDFSQQLPKSRLSPYFSHRSVNGSSTLLGRPRVSSLSGGGNNNDSNDGNIAQLVVRRNVFSSMSDSIAFGNGNDNNKDRTRDEQRSASIVPPPVTLRRISVQRKDPTSSTSPSTTELALGLSNLTMTDEFEVKTRYRSVSVSDGGSSTTSSTGNGTGTAAAASVETTEKKAATSVATASATTNVSAAADSATETTPSDWRNQTRVPMLSPDGKLVGYKQNSSMLRRQMQVSMPFSDIDTATPPESPLYTMSSTSTSGTTPKHSTGMTRDPIEEFRAVSQDPFAGFPDAENQLQGYLLGPVVGRGGFSSVHKGLHVATSLPVAVKVIDKTRMVDPKDRDRVDREMRVMRQLSGHICIAQLLECAETPQYLYIIMEYCAGGSLLDYVRDKRRLSENEASLLFQQLLAALQHCHGRGVVHRDIKLENVLLDGHGGVKLIDFGLCGYYVHDKPLRCHCGSPSYAAPEIVARKDYMAGPVDVWSAGVVLFAMLAGYLPFQARDKKSLSTKIIRATWTPPSCASFAAVDLLERMLTLDPEERICLDKIWEHSWVVNGPRWEGNGEGPNGLMRTTVDSEMADAWVNINNSSTNTNNNGITMAMLLRALRLKECNATTAGYHLLCQAKILSTNETDNTSDQYSKMETSNNTSSCETKTSGERCKSGGTSEGNCEGSSSDLDIFI